MRPVSREAMQAATAGERSESVARIEPKRGRRLIGDGHSVNGGGQIRADLPGQRSGVAAERAAAETGRFDTSHHLTRPLPGKEAA